MAQQREGQNISQLCIVCKYMFGNVLFNHMCSKCFKISKGQQEDKKQQKIQLIKKKTELFQQQKHQAKTTIKVKEQKQKNSTLGAQRSNLELQKKQDNTIKEGPKKCAVCKKKVSVLGFGCKHCNQFFCKMHRLPQQHDCGVDFVSLGRKKLKVQNPVIESQKISKI